MAVPSPARQFDAAGWTRSLDLYETLALAASELKSAADTIYAARRPTEEMPAAARVAAARVVAAINEWSM